MVRARHPGPPRVLRLLLRNFRSIVASVAILFSLKFLVQFISSARSFALRDAGLA